MTPVQAKEILKQAINVTEGGNVSTPIDKKRTGIFIFTGFPGAGKTTLCEAVKILYPDSHLVSYENTRDRVIEDHITSRRILKHPSFRRYSTDDLRAFFSHDVIPRNLDAQTLQIWNGTQITLFNIIDRAMNAEAKKARSENPKRRILVDTNLVADSPILLRTRFTKVREADRKRVYPLRKPGSHSRGEYTVKRLMWENPTNAFIFFCYNLFKASLAATAQREANMGRGATRKEFMRIFKGSGAELPYRLAKGPLNEVQRELSFLRSDPHTQRLIAHIDEILPQLQTVEQFEAQLFADYVAGILVDPTIKSDPYVYVDRTSMVFSLGLLGLLRSQASGH